MKIELYWGKHYAGDADIDLTECGEIPEKLKIPLEVNYGYVLVHYKFIGVFLNIPCYRYQYEQGIFIRSLLN